jgi:hypothetical protein
MTTQKFWPIGGSETSPLKNTSGFQQKKWHGRGVVSVFRLVLLAGVIGSSVTSFLILKAPFIAKDLGILISPPQVAPVVRPGINWIEAWQAPIAAGGPISFAAALKQIAPKNTDLEVNSDISRFMTDRAVQWHVGSHLTALNDVVEQAGAQGRALPGVLLVTPAPFAYRIEKGFSILQQLGAWARHAGWELDWNAVEVSKTSESKKPNVESETPVDWPAAGSANLGPDFDRAFAATIAGLNLVRKQQGQTPVLAFADFATGRIEVRLADDNAASHHVATTRKEADATPTPNVSELRIDSER